MAGKARQIDFFFFQDVWAFFFLSSNNICLVCIHGWIRLDITWNMIDNEIKRLRDKEVYDVFWFGVISFLSVDIGLF